MSFKLEPGMIIDRRFKLLKKAGQGSFGIVYQAYDLELNEHCACKFESRQVRHSMMSREILVLQDMRGISGFPELSHYGKDKQYLYFMGQLLGDNLETVLRKCGGRFSLMTVLQLAVQLIDRMEVFHSKNFIHRDIKPENFVISREDSSLVYLIDFGLAKYYRSRDGRHMEFVQKSGVIGTARYASINTLQWMEQSRRDDLEAIGYMLVYFAKGELPWQNIKAVSKEQKYEAILTMKMSISLSQLCKNLPKCFVQYFQHIKSLLFQQQPNYSLLRALFEQQQAEMGQESHLYNWEALNVIEDLVDPDSLPDIKPQVEFDQSPPVEQEGKAINVQDEQQKHKKFMKQLHEKFVGKYDQELQLKKITSIEQFDDQRRSMATSKVNNYQFSVNAMKIESEPLIAQQINQVPMVIPKRKDSKSVTQVGKSYFNKEIQYKKKATDDFDQEIANDDDANLNIKTMPIKYF